MSVLRFAAAALLAAAPLLTSCSDNPKPTAPPKPTAVSDMDIFAYLKSHNVEMQSQIAADDFPLSVSVRLPPRWAASQAYPNVYLLLVNTRATDQQFSPNALISVIKLTGSFDPKQAVLRGFVNITATKSFHTIRTSLNNFEGFPSAVIEGTVVNDEQRRKEEKAQLDEIKRQNNVEPDPQEPVGDLKLHVLNRYVIASSGKDQYLVQLQITVTDAQATQLASDIKTLDEGIQLAFAK